MFDTSLSSRCTQEMMSETSSFEPKKTKQLLLPSGTQITADIQLNQQGKLGLMGYEQYSVCQATSCLIVPIEGDRVMACVDGDILFITHILYRRQSAALTINSRESDLTIVAPKIVIDGQHCVQMTTPYLQLQAVKSDWIGDMVHHMINRILIETDSLFRHINQTDHTQAKQITVSAQSYQLESCIGSLQGSAVLKIDGGQIHMG